jgi:hypothetical protein
VEGNNRGRGNGAVNGRICCKSYLKSSRKGRNDKARKWGGQDNGRLDKTRRQSKARRDNTSNINTKENKRKKSH